MTNNTSSIKHYDTVATMRSDSTLSFGNFVKTHGYHHITDGGGNLYTITNKNEFASIKLDNGLYAEPKVSGQRVNVRAFGAKGTGYGKPRVNDTEAFNLAFNYASKNKLSIYVPNGQYYITPILINEVDSMTVEGDGQFLSQIGVHEDVKVL
ncbi:glycosyl hydrolase family 28-related protein [Vibrio sp. TRT 21S02]|uniref:glycosyl hydrolase family 28-related protein n=1 Tax=Vibrio sp. TRT 21S02 TaxID=3418507 RepID=UPI003CFB507B